MAKFLSAENVYIAPFIGSTLGHDKGSFATSFLMLRATAAAKSKKIAEITNIPILIAKIVFPRCISAVSIRKEQKRRRA
jgi:hypothetical protein